MKIKSIIALLFSFCLFACSSDDDGDSSSAGLQSGWTTERVDLAVKECAKEEGNTEENCRCIVNETAKIIPFNSSTEPSQEQATAIVAAILKNCTQGLDLTPN